MLSIEMAPKRVQRLLGEFANEFAATVWERFALLLLAAIGVIGPRTVVRLVNVIRLDSGKAGHLTSFHRVFSKRHFSGRRLGKILASALVDHFCPQGMILLIGDDTVTQHRGEQVYGKGCHRDGVRSSHKHLVFRWGHKWVVLALRIKLPLADRTWALPILVALYTTPEESRKQGRRHKTPAQLMRGLLCLWIRWFPRRKAVFSADGEFSNHELTRFAARHHRTLSLVSRFPKDAVLHEAAPPRKPHTNGRPRRKGARMPKPCQVVAARTRMTRLTIAWYGGQQRKVGVVTGVGHWHRFGKGLVEIRWVYVKDRSGTHRDEYFHCSDLSLTPKQIIEAYVGRWDIEVCFEEMRAHLGLEKTRGRCKNTVLRAEPCLFALYSLIVFWFANLPKSQQRPLATWPGKTSLMFSDCIRIIRSQVWSNQVLQSPRKPGHFAKSNRQLKTSLNNLFRLIC